MRPIDWPIQKVELTGYAIAIAILVSIPVGSDPTASGSQILAAPVARPVHPTHLESFDSPAPSGPFTQPYNWSRIATILSPGSREHPAVVDDPADRIVLLFGGDQCTPTLCHTANDTWSYSGGNWINLSSSLNATPTGRSHAAITFDLSDRSVLMYGGYSTRFQGTLSDTWSYAEGRWSPVLYALNGQNPPSLSGASMVYDAADGYVVLFGGCCAQTGPRSLGPSQETWSYFAGNWTPVHVPTAPPARLDASMTYDPVRHEVLLFGGYVPGACGNSSCTTFRSDTWVYRNATWTNVSGSSATSPGPRTGAALVFDPTRGDSILFGGQRCPPGPGCDSADTWTFNGAQWTDITPFLAGATPRDRHGAGFVYDSGDGYDLLSDGVSSSPPSGELNDSWSFAAPASAVLRATPNPTTVGVPVNFTGSVRGTLGSPRYAWSFGDGTFATGPVVSHPFSIPGTLPVELWINGSNGSRLTNRLDVLVVGPPTFSAQESTSVAEVGQAVLFTANVTGGTPPFTVNWSFGDGFNGSGASVLHSYGSAGGYAPRAVVRDGSGASTSKSLHIDVIARFRATFTVVRNITDAHLNVTIHATLWAGLPPYFVRWFVRCDGGLIFCTPPLPGATEVNATNGSTPVRLPIPLVFPAPGNFTVILFGNDNLSPTFNISSISVQIHPDPLTGIEVAPFPVLVGESVGFRSDLSGGISPFLYSWSFGDGTASSLPDPQHAFARAGSYTVRLEVSDSLGLVAAANLTVTVARSLGGGAPPPTVPGYSVGELAAGNSGVVLATVIALVYLLPRRAAPSSARTDAHPE